MTSDDLERLKRHSYWNKQNSSAHQKNFNEDRSILSAGKCTPMIRFWHSLFKPPRDIHADLLQPTLEEDTQPKSPRKRITPQSPYYSIL